jgi:hypothetical protein
MYQRRAGMSDGQEEQDLVVIRWRRVAQGTLPEEMLWV